MEYIVEKLKHCDLLSISGRIDSQSAPELSEALDKIMESGQHKIVLDMSEIEFISSAGLRILINAQKKCKQQLVAGELVLAAVPERVHEALDMAGFLPLFTIEDELTHAVGNI
ncbi:MAG: STAS domain-containing protein [Anaerolineae bacterium]|nr:STAS domain-containing protein [Anaerolineae bacterium]